MNTILCLIYFVILTYVGFKLLYVKTMIVSVPLCQKQKMRCTGMEVLIVFMFATGYFGLMPVLSLRLAVLELLCVLGLFMIQNKRPLSIPLKIFAIFLIWVFIGITYTPNKEYGVRMLLKYIYPFLFAIFVMNVVKDGEVFLKSALTARRFALFAIIISFIPGSLFIFRGVLWNAPALATNFICMCMFSLSLAWTSYKMLKNIVWAILFMLPAFIWVIRTDIFGIGLALSTFFFIKYKIKAIPFILVIGCLGLAALFYIPSVKAKMYYRPDEVTIEDFLTGNVDEENINTSGRKKGWEDVQRWFFEPNKFVGAGTGRVQTYFYTEAIGWQRGGQLHNDFLVLLCDNGVIGLGLFIVAYLFIMFHCLIIYQRSRSRDIRVCALTAGASLIGVFVTMYSDNTISYSMVTLGYPWGFYGMALGLSRNEQMKRL